MLDVLGYLTSKELASLSCASSEATALRISSPLLSCLIGFVLVFLSCSARRRGNAAAVEGSLLPRARSEPTPLPVRLHVGLMLIFFVAGNALAVPSVLTLSQQPKTNWKNEFVTRLYGALDRVLL